MKKIEEIIKDVAAAGGNAVAFEFAKVDPSVRDFLLGRDGAIHRMKLSAEKGLIFDFRNASAGFSARLKPGWGEKQAQAAPEPEPKREAKALGERHTYSPPRESVVLEKILRAPKAVNVGVTGPTGSGKTTMVNFVASKLGRKVYRINCRGDMASDVFFGEKTVVVDEATSQNKIVFVKGLVERAMTEGVAEDGSETGAPAVLLIDEFSSMPAHISTALHRLLETDNPRREMVIDADGGRVVRSHSGFRVVLTGNTLGRGAGTAQEALYTAQGQAVDISLLNRVGAWCHLGYDNKAEERILSEAIADDAMVSKLLKFRDAAREFWRVGRVMAPFSTRNIVDLADMYRILGDIKQALYYSIFTRMLPEEAAAYNEAAVAVGFGDILADYQ